MTGYPLKVHLGLKLFHPQIDLLVCWGCVKFSKFGALEWVEAGEGRLTVHPNKDSLAGECGGSCLGVFDWLEEGGRFRSVGAGNYASGADGLTCGCLRGEC